MKILYTLTMGSLLTLSACGQSEIPIQVSRPDAYITNAEYVLDKLANNEATGIVLHINPGKVGQCNYMQVQISKLGEDDQWENTNILLSGKDVRETYLETNIKNQLVFATIPGPGRYGITSLGCQTYDHGFQGLGAVIAVFDAEPRKLNYIGEIKLVPVPKYPTTEFHVDTTDRSFFVQTKLPKILPELVPYLEMSLMIPPYKAKPGNMTPAEEKRYLRQQKNTQRRQQRVLQLRKTRQQILNSKAYTAEVATLDIIAIGKVGYFRQTPVSSKLNRINGEITRIIISENESLNDIRADFILWEKLDKQMAEYRRQYHILDKANNFSKTLTPEMREAFIASGDTETQLLDIMERHTAKTSKN